MGKEGVWLLINHYRRSVKKFQKSQIYFAGPVCTFLNAGHAIKNLLAYFITRCEINPLEADDIKGIILFQICYRIRQYSDIWPAFSFETNFL